MPARQHPVQVPARMREPVAAITGPTTNDIEKLVSGTLASRADENPLRQYRMRADHHRLIIYPDFSGFACGDLVPPVSRFQPR